MSDDTQKEGVVFDRMPGADAPEAAADEALDFNFGLGEEPVEEPEEDEEAVEEPVAEAEEPAADEPEPVEEEPEAPVEAAEDETEEVVAAEEPKETTQDQKMIPKYRFDQQNATLKEYKKELDALRSQMKEPEAFKSDFDFKTKEVEHNNLVLDGELEKAAALRMQIDEARYKQMEHDLTQKISQNVNQSQQASALQRAAAELESEFPIFDKSSNQFNEKLTDEVNALHQGLMAKDENPVTALHKAVKYVLMGNGYVDMNDPTPEPAGLAASSPRSEDEVAKKRAEVSKKLKAAESQPPQMPGESSSAHGERPNDLGSMTEDEFNALPDATLKRLRGDIL
jgi:hypothetical protein